MMTLRILAFVLLIFAAKNLETHRSLAIWEASVAAVILIGFWFWDRAYAAGYRTGRSTDSGGNYEDRD